MVKKPVAGEAGPNTIYKATYSGVPVYEFICRNVAVMRRRSDAYLNATQILKVAGFDKPQRTRVLEREVQKGEHEKVQGGYGKYQGTWVPIERGLALAKQYNVEDLLRPIIDFVPTSVSPPPAPKHAVAPPTKRAKDGKPAKEGPGIQPKTGPQSAAAIQAQAIVAASRQMGNDKRATRKITPESGIGSRDESIEDSPDDDMSESATPSPLVGTAVLPPVVEEHPSSDSMEIDGVENGMSSDSRKRSMIDDDYESLRRARRNSAVHTPQGSPRPFSGMEPPLKQDEYNDIILNYFISESTQLPSVLTSPPYSWDPNGIIDDDNHTALHWAAAMGRIRVIKLLLSAGARMFDKNSLEQTPLMRSVMFTNNYDLRKFPEVFELLHRSTLNIDKQNRTVFHHIANLALIKGKTHAARYYIEAILSRLADYPQELADVINFQDEDGETALTLAARARSKRIVKALLDHGADPKIRNRDFKSAEDYILEDERFRSSPDIMNSRTITVGPRNPMSMGATVFANYHPRLYTSEAARLAGGQYLTDITTHLQSLARSFDSELLAKERDLAQAKAMLTSIHAEVNEAGRTLHALIEQIKPLESRQAELEAIQNSLHKRLSEALVRGYEHWLQGEHARESRWRAGDDPAQAGEDYSDLEATVAMPATAEAARAEEERLRWQIDERRRRRGELMARMVKAQTEAPSSGKIVQYRKLIAAGCGGEVSTSDLDTVVNQMLETLENEAGAQSSNRPSQSGPKWAT